MLINGAEDNKQIPAVVSVSAPGAALTQLDPSSESPSAGRTQPTQRLDLRDQRHRTEGAPHQSHEGCGGTVVSWSVESDARREQGQRGLVALADLQRDIDEPSKLPSLAHLERCSATGLRTTLLVPPDSAAGSPHHWVHSRHKRHCCLPASLLWLLSQQPPMRGERGSRLPYPSSSSPTFSHSRADFPPKPPRRN